MRASDVGSGRSTAMVSSLGRTSTADGCCHMPERQQVQPAKPLAGAAIISAGGRK
jgi:hypothetical protein